MLTLQDSRITEKDGIEVSFNLKSWNIISILSKEWFYIVGN